MNLLFLIIVFFISFLPIVFWAYIFSYIDEKLASRRRFFYGIIAGIISVIPLLWIEKISSSFPSVKIFEKILSFGAWKISLIFLLTLTVLLIFFSFSSWFLNIRSETKEKTELFWKNIFGFSLFSLFLLIFFILLQNFFSLFPNINIATNAVSFQDISFYSLKLVIFYYCIIGFIEEGSKHFHFLGSGIWKITNPKELVLISIFVALGFSFIENILYLNIIYGNTWWSWELVKTYFFRSSFSLMLHVLCSSVLSYLFSKVWILNKWIINWYFIKTFLIGITLSIWLHAFFDIALSFWLSIFIFIYFIGGYLYVSSIFYRDEKKLLNHPEEIG